MENRLTIEAMDRPQAAATASAATRRRRQSAAPVENLRYFQMKPGSSPAKPELGPEMASEGEALIEAFRSGEPFYTVTVWNAVPEVNGGNPVIVKKAVAIKTT